MPSFKVILRSRKIGISSSSYNELLEKIQKKGLIKDGMREAFILKLEDGTEVDEDYFEVLNDETELFISSRNASYEPLFSRLENFLNNYTVAHIKYIDEKLGDIINTDYFSSLLGVIGTLATESNECLQNCKSEHPLWFEGLNTKFTKKTDVLRNSAETRLRTYLQKLKADMDTFSENKNYMHFLKSLQDRLKTQRFNAAYFDRLELEKARLCSESGRFQCYGAYNYDHCTRNHSINPYESRESRILFSTWNFDHIIEKSRTIIPALKNSLESNERRDINVDYFFALFFEHWDKCEDGNLKLVHVVCHDKSPHSRNCDCNKIFLTKPLDLIGNYSCISYKNRKQKSKIQNKKPKKLKCL